MTASAAPSAGLRAAGPAALSPAAREHVFTTSGHSGRPVEWLRTEEQLAAETALLVSTVTGPVDRVVNFAPPHHLYGNLLGERLPAALGIPVQHLWHDPLQAPALSPGERTLFVCVPSAWLVLRSLTDRIAALPAAVAVHGTGPVTRATAQVTAALSGSGFRAVELFGSTETGAVAHRTPAARPEPEPLWQLFDDVSLVRRRPAGPARREAGGEQPLRVASPRLARRRDMSSRPREWELEDVVRPAGERHFAFLGRSTRLIKINGRRFRLETVEDTLRAALPHVDAVCVPQRDEVRAEHYELFYADALGTVTEQDLRARLTGLLPGVPPPRAVRRVGAVPRGATGKVDLVRLRNEAAGAPGAAKAAGRAR